MQPVVTAAEMKALDRATIEEVGLSGATLMETAGRAVADAAARMVGQPSGSERSGEEPVRGGSRSHRGHVAVICGGGGNGGDGFVAARVLRARGIDAVAYLAVPRAQVGGDAAAHLTILERS